MQTIEAVNDWSTPEAATLLGCSDALIRKLKMEQADHLIEGTHFNKDGQNSRWTEKGIKQLAEWIKTTQAIALRTNLPTTQTESEIKIHETEIKSQSVGNSQNTYADLPNVLGVAIADRLVDGGILERTNEVVIKNLAQRMLNHQPELEVSVKDAFSFLDAIAS
jgi:hypothetical protein